MNKKKKFLDAFEDVHVYKAGNVMHRDVWSTYAMATEVSMSC